MASKQQEEQEHFYSSDDVGDEMDLKKVKFSSLSENTNNLKDSKPTDKLIEESETDDEKYIQNLSEKMNELCSMMRTEVMNNMFDLKKRNVQKLTDFNQRSNEDRDDLILQQRLKEEKLRDSIAKRDYYLARFKTLTFRMADQISQARQVEREKTLVRNILSKWKEYSQEKRRKKNLGDMLLKTYKRNQARKILQGWYMWILNSKQNTTERIWQNRLENEKAELRNDFEMKIEHLKEEILKLNQALEREMNDKQVLQENLKKALMRGVCAMNNKFLEIIKDTNTKPTQSFNVQQELEDALNEVQSESEFIQNVTSNQSQIPRPYPSQSYPEPTFYSVLPQQTLQMNNNIGSSGLLQQQGPPPPQRFITTPMEATQVKNPQPQVRVIRETVNYPLKQTLQSPLHPPPKKDRNSPPNTKQKPIVSNKR